MACPQQSGNSISFFIADKHKATVIVCFTGSNQKQVQITWGNGQTTLWKSCDPEVVPGVSYSTIRTNNSKVPWSAEVEVTYQDMPCSEAPSPSAWQPAPIPVMLVENCNPMFNPIIVGAWLFTTPTQDTVQVTIVVEDEAWTEEKPSDLSE